MNKVAISTAIGIGAGLLLGGAYLGAPYAGLQFPPSAVLVVAAVVAFGSTIAMLALAALSKPPEKGAKPWRRINDLAPVDFPHFPRSGLRLVLRPDSVIQELDVMNHPEKYRDGDVLLTIKKSSGKTIFNPIVLSQLFGTLAGFGGFMHILLVNEHDEFLGYIPAPYARMRMTGPDAESRITKYIIDVLAAPKEKSIDLREIGGLSMDETISDGVTIAEALKKLSEGLFRGFVVFKGKRNRKPIGVIYEDALFRASIRTDG